MKFLLALTFLATTSGALANDQYINCWETAQGERGPVIFSLKINNPDSNPFLTIAYPVETPFSYERHGDCLAETRANKNFNSPLFCLTEGQRINGLEPIDAEFNGYDYTVYCEADILNYF